MQTDMHYYGTYALARAAGIAPDRAGQIAVASQYVDDSKGMSIELQDGGYLDYRPTAHGTSIALPEIKDTSLNKDIEDQRHVWVPFHFLPGCEGASLGEKLICRMDSPVAQKMVDHHLSLAAEPYGILLMGVTAHVYADTFSHYGFSGITSVMNQIDSTSINLRVKDESALAYITGRAKDFWDKCAGKGAEALTKLGHGAAATFPDRPFLSWDFNYTDGRQSGDRDNQSTFLLGCEKLHAMFEKLGVKVPSYKKGDGRSFQSIAGTIKSILAVEGSMEERTAAWLDAARRGAIFGPASGEDIPAYDSSKFENDKEQLAQMTTDAIKGTFVYVFMKAADIHRNYVLHELLPAHELNVVLP